MATSRYVESLCRPMFAPPGSQSTATRWRESVAKAAACPVTRRMNVKTNRPGARPVQTLHAIDEDSDKFAHKLYSTIESEAKVETERCQEEWEQEDEFETCNREKVEEYLAHMFPSLSEQEVANVAYEACCMCSGTFNAIEYARDQIKSQLTVRPAPPVTPEITASPDNWDVVSDAWEVMSVSSETSWADLGPKQVRTFADIVAANTKPIVSPPVKGSAPKTKKVEKAPIVASEKSSIEDKEDHIYQREAKRMHDFNLKQKSEPRARRLAKKALAKKGIYSR